MLFVFLIQGFFLSGILGNFETILILSLKIPLKIDIFEIIVKERLTKTGINRCI